jgi:hypothetical protein
MIFFSSCFTIVAGAGERDEGPASSGYAQRGTAIRGLRIGVRPGMEQRADARVAALLSREATTVVLQHMLCTTAYIDRILTYLLTG